MSNKIDESNYICLSAILRAREARLLSRERMERMLSESSYADACRVAADAGWPDMSEMGVDGINAVLDARRTEEFADIRDMIPDKALLALVCLQYDCHNAKVLVKSGGDTSRSASLFSAAGCYTVEELQEVYDNEESGGALPDGFAEAIHEAKWSLARTGNPQLADYLLDRAYFAELLKTAQLAEKPFLETYVRSHIDKVNLRSLLRTLDMGRRGDLLANALIEGGDVGLEQISDPTLTKEDIARLYAVTIFADAAEAPDMTSFEKAADNAEKEYISGGSLIPYGPEVVLEYAAALENEIVSLRIILTGKRMGIGEETLRERLRESYV
ncbi:MAG: V-type ATPase subunit [Oscillospiraceae bacterium]|nr:V-type ATPase subunit [Oscillospiraceae bacterium]